MFINSSLFFNEIVSNEYLHPMGNGTIESSNITGFSQRTRRHSNFLDPPTILLHCSKGQSFPNMEATCEFVKKSQNCHFIAQRIDYLEVMVCFFGLGFGDSFQYDILICGIFTILLFVIFSYVLGRYFILPNMIYLSRRIHMPPFQYGVIVMALLVAVPKLVLLMDVCQRSGNGTLIISGTLGRTLSCYAFGMATIGLYQKQIKLPAKALTLIIVLVLFALGFTVYVLKFKLNNDNRPPDQQVQFNIHFHASFALIFYVAIILFMIVVSWHERIPRKSDRSTRYSMYASEFQNHRNWRLLFHPLNPYKNIKGSKIIITIFLPFWILSALQVPVVDLESPLNGWSKCLLCSSVLIFPIQLWLQAFNMALVYLTLGICIAIAILIFFFTNIYKIPRLHGLCALAGSFIGFSLFHLLDREMNVLLLQVTSYVFYIPADVSVILGYSACFIVFTLIFTFALMEVEEPDLACGFVTGIILGETFTILASVVLETCYDNHIQIAISAHALSCIVFLAITLSFSLLGAVLTDFVWRRSHGFFVLLLYLAFLINIFLAAFENIHPYGTQHAVTLINAVAHAQWA